jgi:hypothetical protein
MVDVTGTCHCGGVSFRLTDVEFALCCHCSICRRATGAPFIAVAQAKVENADVTLAEGVELLGYETSEYLIRNRCSRCGAGIYNDLHMPSGYVSHNFMVALFDDPAAVPIDCHLFYADRVIDVDDDATKHATLPGKD